MQGKIIADISFGLDQPTTERLYTALQATEDKPQGLLLKPATSRRIHLAFLGSVSFDRLAVAQEHLQELVASLPEPQFSFTGFKIRSYHKVHYLIAKAMTAPAAGERWSAFIRRVRSLMRRDVARFTDDRIWQPHVVMGKYLVLDGTVAHWSYKLAEPIPFHAGEIAIYFKIAEEANLSIYNRPTIIVQR